MDGLFCAAIRDPLGCGLVDVAPDLKSQRVLEHVARALSLAVDDAGGEGTAPSVFAVAAMSDFALDLPTAPEELVDLLMQNRQRLVEEGGIVDQLAGIADFEDDDMNSNDFLISTSQELVEEAFDILKLRALISSQDKALSGILHQRGFRVQVEQLQACVRGSRRDGEDGDHTSGHKLLPGSNQPAPVEMNTWTETWKGPQEDVWEEGEEDEHAGMFDGEQLLGEVISTPDKAAGLGAVGRDRRSLAQRLATPPSSNSSTPAKTLKTSSRIAYQDGHVEDADSMPDSAPERLEGAPARELLLGAETPGSSQRAHVKSADVQIVAAAGAVTEAVLSGDEAQERGLLKPRRKFTKTKTAGVSTLTHVGPQSPEANLDTLNMPPGAIEEKDSAKVVGFEVSAGETGGVVVAADGEVLGEDLRMELGAGEGWEVAHLDRGKQPALRRTQRTVTIRGRAEEEEEEEEEMQEGELRASQVPSARAIVALPPAIANMEAVREVSRKNKEDSGAGAEEPAVVSTEAAPAGVSRLFGVGAVFKRNADGFFYVKKVVLGGPADKAGVKVGSRVVSMDGERLYNKTADQLFKIVLGSEGTTLKLALQPSGAGVRAPEQVVMVRRAFIDEGFLNATAIEPLSKGDAAPGPAAVASWAQGQVHASAPSVNASSECGTDNLGIGVTFKKDGDGFYIVKRVSEHGGAFASGLAVGDRVLSIDGHSMHRKSSHELSRCILGPQGTSLTLSVRSQNGTVRDVQVKRLREKTGGEGSDGEGEEGASRKWGAEKDENRNGEWEGGGTAVDSDDWDGQGEVMRLEGEPDLGMIGIGATLVRDSRGLFVVAEVAPPAPDAPQGRSYNLFVGDIIVQIDGIQVPFLLLLLNPLSPLLPHPHARCSWRGDFHLCSHLVCCNVYSDRGDALCRPRASQ